MQVSFRNTQIAVPQTPQAQPVSADEKNSLFDTSREAWKTTLKTKETACAYTSGFFRGVKNAIYAGAALVGLDWFATSCVNISNPKNANTLSHMLSTPFVKGWKALSNTAKFFVGFSPKDGFCARPFTKSLKMALWDAPKKILKTIYKSNNISKVAKIGLPVVTLAIAGYTTFRSCLNANERNARIDHRYGGEMGHHKA